MPGIGISHVIPFNKGESWLMRCTPHNVVLASIVGGIRVTWDIQCADTETEIWSSVDGAAYTLITTTGLGIETYDYICNPAHDYDIKLRAKLDQTVLNIPTDLNAVDLTGGIVRVTWDDNNTEADHIELWADVAGAGSALVITLLTGVQTYDHTIGVLTNAKYKVRAMEGTLPVYSGFTAEFDITTAGIVDADGNLYTEVVIGAQTWLLENLKTTKYNNGEAITTGLDNATWAATTSGAFAQVNNNAANKADYGLLYNWFAVTDVRGVAPSGYRVPLLADFETLKTTLGGTLVGMGDKLREIGTTHWQSTNAGATNSSGFTARGAGARYNTGPYGLFLQYGIFGLTYEHDALRGRRFHTSYNAADVTADYELKQAGQSIRCVKI